MKSFIFICLTSLFSREQIINYQLEQAIISLDKASASVNNYKNEYIELKKEIGLIKSELKLIHRTKEETVIVRANPPQFATIKIINNQASSQEIIINGETHIVEGNQSKIIDNITPGKFSYQVIGTHKEVQTRDISLGEIYKITLSLEK